MPDAVFDEPRLAEVYDPLDPDRSDLEPYVDLIEQFGARSVLDVGCGTGTLACLLAERGMEVVAVDPAAASLDVARRKQHADAVRWVLGDATTLPPLQVDAAVMTANVAQVFLSDDDWISTLRGVHAALRPDGLLAFETRDPAREAWREWTREKSYQRVDIPGVGVVESWHDLTDVNLPFVSFRSTCVFLSDGAVVTSDSTLRFRSHDEVEHSLRATGFALDDVRDAPDRPGREFVFVAHATSERPDR